MTITEMAANRGFCFKDTEAREVTKSAYELVRKYNATMLAFYLCISYGEIRGVRKERAKRKRTSP